MALAATAILAASCAKEMMTKDAFEQGVFVKRTITADAGLPGADNTDKAYIDINDGKKVKWEANDELRINGTDLRVYSRDSGNVRAKFYGEVTAPNIPGGRAHYWAVYPKSIAPAYSGSGNLPTAYNNASQLTFTLPDVLTIDTTVNTIMKGKTYMAAHASVPQNQDRIDFQMRNLGAVLGITLSPRAGNYSNRVDSVVITSNTNLTGTFTVDTNANPTITAGSGDKKKLLIKFQAGTQKDINITSNKTIYVFLPPLSGKQLNIKVYRGTGYYETVKNNVTLNRSTYYTTTISNVTFNNDLFTVAAGKQVVFSPGNLRYQGSTKKWQFATNQYDRVGNTSGNTSPNANQSGWIDLFGWGTSGYNKKYPYMTSTTNTDYGNGTGNLNSTNYDWGRNAIYNPRTGQTDAAGTWYTLTQGQWNYLLKTRSCKKINSTNNARFTKATITYNTSGTTIKGLIIFPDNYSGPTSNVSGVITWSTINPTATNTNYGWSTTCTKAGWDQLESVGCVFLPVCGYRNGTTVSQHNDICYYWTATHYSSGNAYHLMCYKVGAAISENAERHWGLGVRLVKDK